NKAKEKLLVKRRGGSKGPPLLLVAETSLPSGNVPNRTDWSFVDRAHARNTRLQPNDGGAIFHQAGKVVSPLVAFGAQKFSRNLCARRNRCEAKRPSGQGQIAKASAPSTGRC